MLLPLANKTNSADGTVPGDVGELLPSGFVRLQAIYIPKNAYAVPSSCW